MANAYAIIVNDDVMEVALFIEQPSGTTTVHHFDSLDQAYAAIEADIEIADAIIDHENSWRN